jgi:predicted CXXCH cytochrome family protein
MGSSVAIRVRVLTRLLACIAVPLFVAALPVLADIHPVPLDKNADSAKCLECHADKAKGKAVHTAIATGCTSCHEIRVNKDVTRVKLTTTTPYGLCLTCHADKNVAEIKGVVHKPAVRDCLKCHDPHTTENKFQLVKAMSGGEKENLCLNCHVIGVKVSAKGSRHTALDMGCETCHVTHKTGEPGKVEFDFHLTKSAPALCIDCHDPKTDELQKAHRNQPFATANCLACHDPHESTSPKLMRQFMHPPFADKTCDVCHAPAKDGKVVLTQGDAKALCVMCHDEQAKKIESAKVQHPGAARDCTDCHNPHASRQPNLPKTNGVEICLTCHAEQAEIGKKHVLHQPAFQQACGICHDAHGNDTPKLLRVSNVNGLCLECHGPDRPDPKQIENQNLVAIYNGTVKLPDDYFKKVPVLPLKYGTSGHPTQYHPVSDAVNPKTKTIVAINCLTCHQPHASANRALLAKDQEVNMAFCKTCHKEGTRQLQ